MAAGAALLAAGCGSSGTASSSLTKIPKVQRRSDVEILSAILDLEYKTISAYTAGIPLLDGDAKAAAKQFLPQDLTHAGELQGLIRDAGGKPGKPRGSYPLGDPRSGLDVLRLLHSLESQIIIAYLAAIPRVSPGEVRAALAAVLGNDAQHVSVLRAQLGRPPIPSALVTGRE